MKMTERKVYDCDTSPYWCSEEDYNNTKKTFGTFIEDGRAYRIDDPDTPRPWLNYLSNKKFGSVISNKGLGFSWYASTLLRITKYEHPIDYLPRDFVDGREIIVENKETGEIKNLLQDADDLVCTHRPGSTTLTASAFNTNFELTYFVPEKDACEVCICRINPSATKSLRLRFSQIWSFAKFGIHTAEDGIPYISTPGEGMTTGSNTNSLTCTVQNSDLPFETLYGVFQSPDAVSGQITPLPEKRPDGREFTFYKCELTIDAELKNSEEQLFEIISGAEVSEQNFATLQSKYAIHGTGFGELQKIEQLWQKRIDAISCSIPDKNVQNFLNVWLKNQLHLISNFVRSGHHGYRDSLQDAWGMTLIDTENTEKRLFEILSYQCADGTAPRNFSAFADGIHDMRRFMDSPVWIPRTLIDLIKETGDFAILQHELPFLDSAETATIDEHIFRALDYLYQHRGAHGICLTGDGDWNDALEGISRDGDAESVWLTIALYDAMKTMQELYTAAKILERASIMAERSSKIKHIVNDVAWDGDWYIYGFTGSGKTIGSKKNREGKIHLNAQAWAVFSGLADKERAKIAMESIATHLDTPLGPALMAPPYVDEADEVGRIANLEPGTFENASIYQHAVTFYIFANLADSFSNCEKAFKTFANLLPTNPDNFDCRRTSEPYCTGNYYCGPGHSRFGQNFFTWFTGNASWLLRAGFDEMLGVKADFNGLKISPRVPDNWKNFSVKRTFRNCTYYITFTKSNNNSRLHISVDGKKIDGNSVPLSNNATCEVKVEF
jgi:cellobiose phosphorylase